MFKAAKVSLNLFNPKKHLGFLKLIVSLQNNMLLLAEIEGKTKIIEEISEAIVLMVIPGKDVLSKHQNIWSKIIKTAKYITTLRSHEKSSISSKVIFQNYDIIEANQ